MAIQFAPLIYGAGLTAMRYGPQALRGFRAWLRSPASKQMALQTAKMAPATLAGDYAADKAGRLAKNQDLEDFADVVGIANAARKVNPYATGFEAFLHKLGLNWEQFENNLPGYIATTANALGFNSDGPDPSVQQIPSPRRTDMRLNEPLFRNPRVYGKDVLYTTPLNAIEQKGFQAWLKTLPDHQRSGLDYDLQGYYKSARDGTDPRATLVIGPSGAHFNDVRKTPFHPTFSNQSMFHNVDGWQGGDWIPLNPEKTQWGFNVGSTNRMPTGGFRRGGLIDYFANNEQGNIPLDTRQNIINPTPFIYIRGH